MTPEEVVLRKGLAKHVHAVAHRLTMSLSFNDRNLLAVIGDEVFF